MSYEQKRRHDSRDYDEDYDEVSTYAPRMSFLGDTERERIQETVSRRRRPKVKVVKYIEAILPSIPEKEKRRRKIMRPPLVSERISEEVLQHKDRWDIAFKSRRVGVALTPSQRRMQIVVKRHENFLDDLFKKEEEKVPVWLEYKHDSKPIMRIEARPYRGIIEGENWIDPCCVCGRHINFRQGTSLQGPFPMMIHKSCRRVILERRRTS